MTFEFAKSLFLLIFKNYQIIPSDSELNVQFEKIQGNFHKILGVLILAKKKEKKKNQFSKPFL